MNIFDFNLRAGAYDERDERGRINEIKSTLQGYA